MRESFTYGSVRGAARKGGSYRDLGRALLLSKNGDFILTFKTLMPPLFRGCKRQHRSRESGDLRSARWAGQKHRPQPGACTGIGE